MAGMILFGTLAAFGALCALWMLVGTRLPGDRAGLMIYCWHSSAVGRGFVIRWRLQWDLGLLRGRLAVIDLGMTEEDRAFLNRWGRNTEIWERESDYGERIRDHSGRDCRCGISEL